jgi:hypothetical protein
MFDYPLRLGSVLNACYWAHMDPRGKTIARTHWQQTIS